MPNSPLSPSLKEEVLTYLRNWHLGVSIDAVRSNGNELLVLKSDHHLVGFAFAGSKPTTDYDATYELFKDHYSKHRSEWDALDVAYVLCISPDAAQLNELASRIETDTYFCRKFVIPLSSPVGGALARLPFLPLEQLQGPSLRPASAQTFLQRCGVPANLARDIVVQHARGPEGIIEDCQSGQHGKPVKLKRAENRTVIQGDSASNPVVLEQITIKNFRAYRQAKTFAIGKHVTILYGPNGFGKTSVFDAIDFAVTGTIGRLQTSSDDRFRKFATHLDAEPDEASVTLHFRDADTEHTIVRTVEHSKRAALDNTPQDRKDVLNRLTGGEAIADRVDNLISLFRATHLFSQDSQELAKDFLKDCTISSDIVSRMLAFEDYANAVSKSSKVAEQLAGLISKIADEIEKSAFELKTAREELNELRQTTKDTANIGVLNAEIEAVRANLKRYSIDLPKGHLDVAAIRGGRATLETRIASDASARERLVALTKEVATFPAVSREMEELQPRLHEAEIRRKAASERRNDLHQRHGRAQNELASIVAQLNQARASFDNLSWLRDTKPAYANLLAAEKNAATQLGAASAAVEATRNNQARVAAELGTCQMASKAAIDQAAAIRTRLDTIAQLRTIMPRWQVAASRLQEVQTLIETQYSNLASLGPREQALRQAINTNTAEQNRLSGIIASVDQTQSETRQLLSQLQRHVTSGICLLCGEDHGSKDNLVERINRQLSQDSASEARALVATVRAHDQNLSRELTALQAAQRAAQDSTRNLNQETNTLNAEIKGYIQLAASLGIAVSASFHDLAVALENEIATAGANLSREEQTIRVVADATENARKGNDNSAAALAAAVASEVAIKQNLDSIRRQLASMREDPRTIGTSIDVADHDVVAQLAQLTAMLNQLQTRQGEVTQQATQLQQQTDQAARDVTRAANEHTALRNRLTALQQLRAAVTGRLKDMGLPEDSAESELLDRLSVAAAKQAELQSLHSRISSVEIGMDSVTTAAALSRLRDAVASLQKSLTSYRRNRSSLKPWQSYFEEIKKLVSSEQEASISNFIEQYGPRTSVIQRRLRSVYGFGDIKILSRQSEIRVSAERNGEQLPPTDYFSQSQIQTLLLGLFLTACSSQNWSSFSPILLDDPVTHFDDLNIYALLDLVLGLLKSESGRRQFIISTCDEKMLQLAQQKFALLHDGAVFYRFTAISENGPEVERIQ
jgi:exonuclease SbcC